MAIPRGTAAAVCCGALIALVGCARTPTSSTSISSRPRLHAQRHEPHVHSKTSHRDEKPEPSRTPTRRHHPKKAGTHHTHPPRAASDASCPAGNVLAGVYHPYRLNVLDPCRAAAGTITTVIHEEDGDLHLYLDLDRRFIDLAPAGMLTVELMPRDGGHLPAPSVGEHVSFVGAWAWDGDHNWRELHPVWSETFAGNTYTSGPRFGGSPSYADYASAWRLCRTASGEICTGYGTVPPVVHKGGSTHPRSGGNCNPNYGPVCVPNSSSDLDCPDIPFHDFHVTGTDVYGFDGDGDRVACES